MNLKPAPFAITPARVAALLGERSAAPVTHVPFAPFPLVNQPTRADDTPKLAHIAQSEVTHG